MPITSKPITYSGVSTEMLMALLDIPNLLSTPLVAAELIARGIDRRQVNRRVSANARGSGRRSTDNVHHADTANLCTCSFTDTAHAR